MAETAEKRDYYDVLGVDRSASRDQIKQAYRKLALQYHPDRNRASDATAKFREIAEAYAVLSDDRKRREYDAGGHAGISERWSADDLMRDFHFGDFFGGRFGDLFGIFGEALGRPWTPGGDTGRGPDLRYDLDLTLEEAAEGGDRVLHITRSEPCRDCQGTGAKPGTKPLPCQECKGSGQKQQVRTGKGVQMITVTTCPKCGGRGLFIESPCQTCNGQGRTFAPHSLKVRVPPGIDDGMVIRLAGQGESRGTGTPGDLLIHARLRPHPSFERHGDDLYTPLSLTLAEAALGAKKTVPSLQGESLMVTIPPGMQGGSTLRLSGKGMPRLGGKGKGHLYAVVGLRTPVDLTDRQKALLEEFNRLERAKGHG